MFRLARLMCVSSREGFPLGKSILLLCGAGILSLHAGPVEDALADVRDTKQDLFSPAPSSVLGELPGPAELAAAQPSRRFKPRLPADCVVEFDEETRTGLARDYAACTFIWTDRQRIPMFPMGITGAYLFDLWNRTELIVVMVEDGSPADGVLQPYDVIIGANGRLFDDPVDSRPTLGAALAESQSPELEGKLTVQVVREGVPSNLVIDLGDSEPFSPTWPFNCPKSDRIAGEALECVKQHGNLDGRPGLWEKLFLMASDDHGAMEMARRQIYETAKLDQPLTYGSNWTWFVAFDLVNHCEYYLRTGDTTVLSAIQQGVEELNRRQFASGGWGNRHPPGYGEVNNVGYTALIGLILARECGADVNADKLALAIRYFGKFCGVGTPYGDNIPPMRSGGGHNGINALNAMAYNLLGETQLAQRTARTICYSWPIREKGHSESTFSFAWGPVGARLAPPEEYHMFMDNMLWYYELMRTRDGGFAFSGSTRFGYPRGTTSTQALFLFQRDPKLRILGAPKGPFAHPVPKALAPAIALFEQGDMAAARAEAGALVEHKDETVSTRAEMLRQIIDFRQANVAFALESVQQAINAGNRETANRQIDALERLLGEPAPQTTALRTAPPAPGAPQPAKPVLHSLIPVKNEEAMQVRRPNPPPMLWKTILPFAEQGVRKMNLLRSEGDAETDEVTRTFEMEEIEGEWLRVLLKHTEGGKIYLNGQMIALINMSWSSPHTQVAPSTKVGDANAYILWPVSMKALRTGTNTITYKPLPRSRCTMDISLQTGPYIPGNNNLMKDLVRCWTFDEETPGTHAGSWGNPKPILALGKVETCKGAQGSALLLQPNPPQSSSPDAGLLVIPDPKEPADDSGDPASMTLSFWVKNAGTDVGYLALEHAEKDAAGKLAGGWRLNVGRKYSTFNLSASATVAAEDGPATVAGKLGEPTVEGDFHHIVLRFQAENHQLSLFSDGQLLQETTLTAPIWMPPEHEARAYAFGGNPMIIDDLAIWKRALSDSEIVQIFSQRDLTAGMESDAQLNAGSSADVTTTILQGLAHYWGFDESAGTLVGDACNPERLAFLLGAGQWNPQAEDKAALTLTATTRKETPSGHILFYDLPDPAGEETLGSMTVSVRVALSGRPQLILDHSVSDADGSMRAGWRLEFSNAGRNNELACLAFEAAAGEEDPITLSNSIVPGQPFLHWVLVYDRDKGQLTTYCNGRRIETLPVPENTLKPCDGRLRLSTRGAGTVAIDELAIWHRALSWSEVVAVNRREAVGGVEEIMETARIQPGESPPAPAIDHGILHRWAFDENQGLITRDLENPDLFGMIHGDASWIPGTDSSALQLSPGASVHFAGSAPPADDNPPAASMTMALRVKNAGSEAGRLAIHTNRAFSMGAPGIDWQLDIENAGRGTLAFQSRRDGKITRHLAAAAATDPQVRTTWVLVYNRETSTLSAYCNGARIQRSEIPDGAEFLPAAAGTVLSQSGKGDIRLDEWMTWNRALTPYEIAGLSLDHFRPAPAGGQRPAAAQLPHAPFTDLLDYWPLEHAEGNWLTNLGRPEHAAYFAGSAKLLPGHVGSRMQLEANPGKTPLKDAAVLLPNLQDPVAEDGSLDSMTLSMWAGEPVGGRSVLSVDHLQKVNGKAVAGWLLDIDLVNPSAKADERTTAQFQAVAAGGEMVSVATALPETHPFAHWAVTYERTAGTLVLYCNGCPVARQTVPKGGLLPARSTVRISADNIDRPVWFDEVTRWKRALSAKEIRALAQPRPLEIQNAATPADFHAAAAENVKAIVQDLRDYWPFDETDGTRVEDRLNPRRAAVAIGRADWTAGAAGAALKLFPPDPESARSGGALVFSPLDSTSPGTAARSVTLALQLQFSAADQNAASLVIERARTGQWNGLVQGWRLSVSQTNIGFEARHGEDEPITFSETLAPVGDFRRFTLVYDHEQETLAIYCTGRALAILPLPAACFGPANEYPKIYVGGKSGSLALDELALWPRALSRGDILLLNKTLPLCDEDVLTALNQRPTTADAADMCSLDSSAALRERWRFDENRGRVTRDDGGRPGLLHGPTEWVGNDTGSALRMSPNSAVYMPSATGADSQSKSSMTLLLRVKSDPGAAGRLTVERLANQPGDKLSTGWKLDLNTEKSSSLAFTATDGTARVAGITAAGTAQPDEFTDWALVCDASAGKISVYCNGERVHNSSAARTLSLYPSCGITVGYAGKGGLCLDDFAVWGRALSAYEVAAYHQGHLKLPAAKPAAEMNDGADLTSDLTSYWTFDQADGPWLPGAATPASPAYFAGSAKLADSYFGSAVRLDAPDGKDDAGNAVLVLPDLRDPAGTQGKLDSMTLAFWAGSHERTQEKLQIDHLRKDGDRAVAGWSFGIDFFNPYVSAGTRTSATFKAVTAEGEPFEVSAALPATQPLAHWAVTYDRAAQTVKLFRNGQTIAAKQVQPGGLLPAASSATLTPNPGKKPVWVDELACWNRALSEKELTALVQAGTIPAASVGPGAFKTALAAARKTALAGLRDYWHFGANDNGLFHDRLRPGSAALRLGNAAIGGNGAEAALQLRAADPAEGLPDGRLIFAQPASPAESQPSDSTLAFRIKCLDRGQGNTASLWIERAVKDGRNELRQGWRLRIGESRNADFDQVFLEACVKDAEPVSLTCRLPVSDAFNQFVLVYSDEKGILSLYCDGLEMGRLPVPGLELTSAYPDIFFPAKTGCFALSEMAVWARMLSHRDILVLNGQQPLCDDTAMAELKRNSAVAAAPKIPAPDLTDGLREQWRFDENRGRFVRNDAGRPGLVHGAAEWRAGGAGAALALPPKTALYMPLASGPENPSSMTLALRVKSDQVNPAILRMEHATNRAGDKLSTGWKLEASAGTTAKLAFTATDGAAQVASVLASATAPPDEFAEWVLVCNGGAARISVYCNGDLVKETGVATPLALNPPCGTTLTSLGKAPVCLDQWTVWDKPLTAYEVAAYHQGHLKLPAAKPAAEMNDGADLTSDLVGYWTFDQADGPWLPNAKSTAPPAYFAGSAMQVERFFGSAIRLGTPGNQEKDSDSILLLPDLRDPQTPNGMLDSMTVALWAGQISHGKGVLCLDHASRINGKMTGGWVVTIDPFNPTSREGAKGSFRFEAVAGNGEPVTVEASLAGEQPLAHWGVTYDYIDNTVRLFCNGARMAERKVPGDGLRAAKCTARIHPLQEDRAVCLDELAIWNRALSQQDLGVLARAGNLPLHAPPAFPGRTVSTDEARRNAFEDLRDYWSFNEADGKEVHDLLRSGSAAQIIGNADWTDGVAGSAIRLSAADKAAGLSEGSLVFAQFQPAANADNSSITLSFRVKCVDSGTERYVHALSVGRAVTGQWNRLDQGWRVCVGGNNRPSETRISVEMKNAGGELVKQSRVFPENGSFRHIVLVFDQETNLLAVYCDGMEAVELPVEEGFDLPSLYPDISLHGQSGTVALDELAIWPRALTRREILLLKDCTPLCSDTILDQLRQRPPAFDRQGPIPLKEELANCWRFDEKTSQKTRDDKSGKTAVLDGAVDWVDGRRGAALAFYDKYTGPGTVNGSLILPYVDERMFTETQLSSTTVSFWCRPELMASSNLHMDHAFVQNRGRIEAGWSMSLKSFFNNKAGKATRHCILKLAGADGKPFQVETRVTAPRFEYAHWVWTYNQPDRTIAIYRNGKKIVEKSTPEKGFLPLNSDIRLYVGKGAPVTVDELLIWQRALSPYDVARLHSIQDVKILSASERAALPSIGDN